MTSPGGGDGLRFHIKAPREVQTVTVYILSPNIYIFFDKKGYPFIYPPTAEQLHPISKFSN